MSDRKRDRSGLPHGLVRLTEDEAALYTPSRERYMQIVRLLEHHNGPSRRITSTEVANAVGWREDQLPEWVTDQAFEAELEELIDNHQVVWICRNCDGIVSFYAADSPEGEADLVRGLVIVYSQRPVPCPFCEAQATAFYDTAVLRSGKPARLSFQREMGADELEQQTREQDDDTAQSQNERFLDHILRTRYMARPHTLTDTLSFSDSTQERSDEHFRKTASQWHGVPGAIAGDARSVGETISRLGPELSLRPQWAEAGSNVLGRIWDSVKLMVQDRYPDLADSAVGIAKSLGLSANAHVGDAGEAAIVLEFGLFDKLYHLNNLLNLAKTGEQRDWSVEELGMNLIAALTSSPVDPRRAKTVPSTSYRSEDEFWRAHLITNSQQQFVILHELGHIVQFRSAARERERRDARRRSLEAELKADRFAIDLIVEKGDDFYIPWMQHRSIFWLTEYWHVMAMAMQPAVGSYEDARIRWDAMQRILESSGIEVKEQMVKDLRMFMDLMLKGMGIGGG